VDGLKTCSKCRILQSTQNFYRGICKDGLASWCKPCMRKLNKKWRQQNKNKVKKSNDHYNNTPFAKALKRASHLQKTYGLSTVQYHDIFYNQNGCCAICQRLFTSQPFVDHDHKTKVVRGLLCLQCNSGLGYFKDKAELLEKALEYLRKPRG